jgi:flagellar basal body rod protein FlgC
MLMQRQAEMMQKALTVFHTEFNKFATEDLPRFSGSEQWNQLPVISNVSVQDEETKMIRALYTAASGMSAQQLNLDTIANNLANSSTTGFRQLRLEFQDMVYQNLVTPGAAQSQNTVSAGLQIGLGTKSAATEVIMTQGSLNQTSNPLDVAIEGSGFFQVQRPMEHRLHPRRAVSAEQPGNDL